MPAISSGKVLATGANGFIAVWTVKAFLEAGFSVRGTVRDGRKAEHLRTLFGSYGDKLELYVVPDMTKEGAFDDAVVGVDAVVHTASPVNLRAEDPDEQIVPAVQGTLGVLRSASKVSSVERVVFLSSCAAVSDARATTPREYDETCWNEADLDIVKEQGRAAPQLSKYRVSKIYAERGAWEYYEQQKEKGAIGWELTVLNPPWVFGPVIHDVARGVESLNASNKFWYNAVVDGESFDVDHSWIDVRDLARGLILAIIKPEAGGKRLIVAAGPFRWQDFVLAAHRISDKTRAPVESYHQNAVYTARMNVTKAKELLGLSVYRSIEETTRDILKDYETHGWL